MSRPFWITTVVATLATAVLINRWADTWVDAAIILTTFIWAEFCIMGIDLFRASLTRKP
jgi:hypothetical protein